MGSAIRTEGLSKRYGATLALDSLDLAGDPPGPVDAVKEPVHHHQQHQDRGDAGGSLLGDPN